MAEPLANQILQRLGEVKSLYHCLILMVGSADTGPYRTPMGFAGSKALGEIAGEATGELVLLDSIEIFFDVHLMQDLLCLHKGLPRNKTVRGQFISVNPTNRQLCLDLKKVDDLDTGREKTTKMQHINDSEETIYWQPLQSSPITVLDTAFRKLPRTYTATWIQPRRRRAVRGTFSLNTSLVCPKRDTRSLYSISYLPACSSTSPVRAGTAYRCPEYAGGNRRRIF